VGANVNVRLFRGYATTVAAVREGHLKILEVLINGGATKLTTKKLELGNKDHIESKGVE
jgi:hypothetical protein